MLYIAQTVNGYQICSELKPLFLGAYYLERNKGFKPFSSAWKAEAQSIYQSRIYIGGKGEIRTHGGVTHGAFQEHCTKPAMRPFLGSPQKNQTSTKRVKVFCAITTPRDNNGTSGRIRTYTYKSLNLVPLPIGLQKHLVLILRFELRLYRF